MTEEFSEDGVKRALVSNSNTVALLSFVISIIGFFVPLIVAFGLLGRGTSSTSAALGSVFSSKKSNKNKILSFIKNKKKLKRRKETKLQERSGTSEEITGALTEAFSDRKCFRFLSISYFQNGHTMRTLIVVVGIFYTVLLSGSTVDALQLSEYSEVFSQYSDSLGNDGVYRILLDASN